jgi:hypothetical protein
VQDGGDGGVHGQAVLVRHSKILQVLESIFESVSDEKFLINYLNIELTKLQCTKLKPKTTYTQNRFDKFEPKVLVAPKQRTRVSFGRF